MEIYESEIDNVEMFGIGPEVRVTAGIIKYSITTIRTDCGAGVEPLSAFTTKRLFGGSCFTITTPLAGFSTKRSDKIQKQY